MKEIRITGRFKKDVKRIQHHPEKVARLEKVIRLLRQSGFLPQEYRPHRLTGNYKGCMECHVENDSLLIWIDETESIIKLLRYGSHSEIL